MLPVNLRALEIFCEVAVRRSFSDAAKCHHVSQSSASQSVQLLEERLGVELIDRSVRPLELTPAGEVYFEGCRELLTKFRQLEDRVLAFRDRVVGSVRVAAIYSVGFSQMDIKAREFRQRYPEAELDLRYLHPEQVYEGVEQDQFDLGLLSFPSSRHDLNVLPWQEQLMVFVVSPRHPLAEQERIAPSKLSGSEFVTFTDDLRIRRVIDAWYRDAGLSVRLVHEFDNVESIKSAVSASDSAVALLPKATIERELANGSLRAIVPDGVQWYRPLGVIHKAQKHVSMAARKFIELLMESDAPPLERTGSAVLEASAKA